MKKTPFTDLHIALGAKMHEFAGYNMPIEYTGIIDEHHTVRTNVGVFDVSHMGEFWVKGPKALSFLQKISSNNVADLTIGKAQYAYFPNNEGGIVDDLVIYKYEEEKYMLVVNAANIEKDWNWCVNNNTDRAELENASDHIAQLAVQGPKALEVLQKLTIVDLKSIPFYQFKTGELAGVKEVIISNTGYTGAGGFELYFYPEYGEKIWESIFEAGAEFEIKPCGLGCRDTLRLEMGYCLYGNDITDTTSPIAAGLGWITKFTNEKEFISKDKIEAQKKNGTLEKLVGFRLSEKGIPRQGYEIVNEKDETIGRVTSGSISPTLKEGIGLGYIVRKYAEFGNEIFIKVRNKNLKATVVKLPFVSK